MDTTPETGRRRARRATGALVALSLAGVAGVAASVPAATTRAGTGDPQATTGPAPAGQAPRARAGPATTQQPGPTVGAGGGRSPHAHSNGS